MGAVGFAMPGVGLVGEVSADRCVGFVEVADGVVPHADHLDAAVNAPPSRRGNERGGSFFLRELSIFCALFRGLVLHNLGCAVDDGEFCVEEDV